MAGWINLAEVAVTNAEMKAKKLGEIDSANTLLVIYECLDRNWKTILGSENDTPSKDELSTRKPLELADGKSLAQITAELYGIMAEAMDREIKKANMSKEGEVWTTFDRKEYES